MNLTRTTLRLHTNLKNEAERLALENGSSLQEIFNAALDEYLSKKSHVKTQKIMFLSHNFGIPLDNLTRDDFYPDPEYTLTI